jgi:hypothetical protein
MRRHNYSNLPGCRQDPGTSQDLAATRGCILEPARIWQPPQQGDITNTFSHHRYRQSKITFIDKLGSHQVSSYSHQGLFGWSHDKTTWSPKPGSIWPQPSKPSRFLKQQHLTKEDWMSFKFLVTINSLCTTVKVALSVDGLLKMYSPSISRTRFTSSMETSTGGLKSCKIQ